MRRTLRAVPALALGGLFGALVAGVLSLIAVPFLVRRVAAPTTSFELKQLVIVVGLTGVVLGALSAGVAKVGGALLRRPDDPPPRRRPMRLSIAVVSGAVVGGFFGFGLHPVFMAVLGRYDNSQLLLTPGRFFALSTVVGLSFGIAAAALVVAYVPSIAPVHRRVRVRAQHLYEGPVRTMDDLAVLLHRVQEGGQDALAAGKEFHLN